MTHDLFMIHEYVDEGLCPLYFEGECSCGSFLKLTRTREQTIDLFIGHRAKPNEESLHGRNR